MKNYTSLNMKAIIRLASVVCLLAVGVGNAWGAYTALSLPKSWSSGVGKSGYTEALGCQQNGLGTDYSSSTSPNTMLKFDTEDGYLTIKLADVPEQLSYYIKSNSFSGGVFKVQQSPDSVVFTNVAVYTSISDGQKSHSLAHNTRYIRFVYTSRDAGNVGLGTISITKCTTSRTVTFNKQGGIFDDDSEFTRTTPSYQIDEASNGAGITLPSISPSSACAAEGWGFCGWSTAAVASETTTIPTTIVGKAGDKYYPSANTPLHAVFVKGEYTKETTSITDDAKYLIVANSGGKNYILKYSNVDIGGYTGVEAAQIDETSDGKYDASTVIPNWMYTFDNTSSSYYIRDVISTAASNYVDFTYGSNWYGFASSSADPCTFSVSAGVWNIVSDYDSETYLGFDATDKAFFAYSSAKDILLYKAGTITYYSTPSCCEYEVSVSESGSSHISSMTFSASSVVTCGDAASRTITITVTPSSGYTLFGDTKPVFTKTSGTVTATIGSVTDNGNGTFSYECTFNSNDNGAGTFAISPGQFINYRTLCCTKYDITLASSGSKTGGSFEVDPAKACEGTEITLMATPDDGYEFSAWTITNDDDDDDDVTTTVLGSGNEDEDAIEFDMPAYNITIDATFTCTEPTISAQPSGASYTQGDDATALSVTASAGTGSLDYQWQSSSDNSSWNDIDKETSSTYTPSTTSTGTMYYRVVVTNHECSESVESDAATIVVSAPSVCATPTFSVAAGTYGSAQSVELSCKTDGATIRYTTNGDDPDGSSTAYSSAISVSVNTTIKAKAFKDGMTASTVASATYNIRCAAPTFNLAEDIYVGSQSLTMSSATDGATIRYTTDESEPTGSSTAYSSALTVGATTTYKAKAYKDGMTESEESEVYIMIQCAEPTFNVSAGTYNANQSVSISTTYGTTIYYTLDGNDPTTKSSTYSSALTIDATKTLKAIAVKDGCENSDVASATYTLKCLQPTFSVDEGTYTGAQSVSMSCATTGSAIHYTTNGTDPTGSSATYSSAISVGTNQTVKAIATKTGWSDSDVASAAYTIQYTAAVAEVDNVTISATTPSVAEGKSAVATYGSTVTLSYTDVASGKTWGGWRVYMTGDASTTVTVTSNQFTMPAYNVTVSAFLYGVSDAIAWCDPDVEVTGDVHLTSYNGISVNSTSAADNLIEISSSDMGSATKMEVAYLNADAADAEVDKDESVFRFYNAAGTDAIDAIDLDYEWGTSHSIKYTPNAYNQRDNYKLQFTLKRGDKVLKTVTHAIYGRALPEEFVIASKYSGHWYALPNTMGTATETVTPILITVDNTTTPTEASYAPSTAVYKGADRKRPGNNVNSIRLTNDGSHWLITNNSNAQLGLSATETEGYENREVWYLKSSNFGVYELAMDPAQSPSKKLGMYSGNMGMYADPAYTSEDIYLLPITNKYTPVDATATDWTGDAIGVTASTSATKMGIAQEDGTETDPVTLSSSGTSHAADFDGDIDFTGLTGEILLLKWYDGSDNLIGGSQVTVPSIVLAGDNDEWSDFTSAPTLSDIVVLSKPMTIDKVAKAKQIVIDQSGSNTGKLVINADQSLIVDGKISKFADGAFGGTSASDLAILSSSSGTGALITGEASDNTQAAVQFYSKARYESGYVNQFIGVPLSSMTAYNGFYGTSLRVYDDANDKWQVLGNNAAMYPFTAYNLMRKETSAGTLYMEGTLNLPGIDGTKTLEMGTRVGDYLFANSWTAPIDVTALDADDFSDANATIYIFNAGTKSDYGTNGGNYTTYKTDNPGQWLYMPVSAVKASPSDFSLKVIPSMEAFMVKSSAANATLTLDYKKHVYDPAKTSGAAIVANRAPRREASKAKHEIIRVRVEGTSGYADDLLLFIGNDFSNGYDNGWEAYKVSGKAYTPQLYAVTEDGKKAISAQPDANNTVIGFKAGTEDDVYTFTLDYEGNDASLYLHDTYTDDYVRVEKDATYTFLTTDNTDHPRFVLTRFNAPQVTTGVDDLQWNGSKARKLMIDGILYIIRDGRIYNAEGALVK